MRQPALIGALIVVGAGAPAMATQLENGDLKTAVSGKTVTIDTPLGLPITVSYGANGLMTGTAGTALAVYLGSGKDRGRWHVRNGKLCQKWFKWLSGDMTCLTLRQDGNKIHWRSDEGQSGTAMIEPGPPAFDGVTAAGLGVPPPPARDEDVAQRPPQERAHDHAAPPKSVGSKSWSKTVAVHKATPRSEVAPAGEPRLIHAIAPATRPKFMVASMAPVPLPVAKPDRSAEAQIEPEPDPFDAAPFPMRRAADEAAIATLEHRWCLSNAFAKGPAAPKPAEGIAAPELVNVPSLLAVAQEQAYDGELPLHEASCLTEDPGINIVVKFLAQAGKPLQ